MTKIKVKLHSNSSKEEIKLIVDGLEVWIKEKAIDNKANIKLIKLLEKHFKKEVVITSGFTSKTKIVEVR